MDDRRLLLGVTRDPHGVGVDEWERLIERCRRETAALVGGDTAVEVSAGSHSALIACGSFARWLPSSGAESAFVVPTSSRLVSRDGSSMDELVRPAGLAHPELARRLASVCPPFGYLGRDPAADVVIAGTDSLGLRHVYVAEHRGTAMVATSSTLLAKLTHAPLDEVSCRVYSLIGCFLGSRSIYQGVRKLDAGEWVCLHRGRLTTSRTADAVPTAVRRGASHLSMGEAVTSGEATVGRVLAAFVRAYPSAPFELSGGMDSRLLVAMAARSGAPAAKTLTLGGDGSADVRIAGQISRLLGLDGQAVTLPLIDEGDAGTAWRHVEQAARHRDFASNGLSGGLYDAVAAESPAGAQVTGQGGELGRGSYYTGQRASAHFDAERVARLLHWRLAVNQAADQSLFTADFRHDARRTLRDASWAYVEDLDGEWPAVTDQVYLFGRMQRWAGAVYSQWGNDRDVLAPFFHPDYVEWASRVPLAGKRNSRAFVAVLERVAPDLVRMPLDSGLTPLQLAGLAPARTRRLRRDLRRAGRKVRQQLTGRRKEPVGTDRLARLVRQRWRADFPRELERVPWLDQVALEQVAAGRRDLDAVSVAFLANVAGAVAAVEGVSDRGMSGVATPQPEHVTQGRSVAPSA